MELDSYLKLRFKRQPLYSHPELSSGFEVQSKHVELILSVVNDMENLLGRKLRILEIGASQGFLTHALANRNHSITSIEWEIENFNFLKLMQENNQELEKVKIHFLEINDLNTIPTVKYDLALIIGTLDHVYRCLNIDKQGAFSDFIRANSMGVIWELPEFEQNAHWNWSLPENKFSLIERFTYIKELTWLRTHSRGAPRPLIFSSDELVFSNGQIKKFRKEDLFQKHQYVDGKTSSRKTFNVDGSIIKTEIHPKNMANSSEIFLESNFLESFANESKSELRFPSIIKLEKGVLISQFERECIPGKRLDEVISRLNADQILEKFILLISKLAKARVFPNDLRPWNILWDENDCHLIDFSSTDYFDRDVLSNPQVVSFLAIANFIQSAKLGTPQWSLEEIMEYLGEQEIIYSEFSGAIFDFAWLNVISKIEFLIQVPYQDYKSAINMVLTEVERVWGDSIDATKQR